MAQIEVAVPKMGESIVEATILKWLKKEGDRIELDETLLEVATDKVDSEVPSPAQGILVKIIGQVNDVVAIGKTIAIIETEANVSNTAPTASISAPSTTESHAPIKKLFPMFKKYLLIDFILHWLEISLSKKTFQHQIWKKYKELEPKGD